MFGIDSATLAYFMWVSLRCRRIWTVAASAFMTLIVASHVATAIDFRLAINTFRLGMALWSYGILACIGLRNVVQLAGAIRDAGVGDPLAGPAARVDHPRCNSTVGASR
jgi:hypothetical protein